MSILDAIHSLQELADQYKADMVSIELHGGIVSLRVRIGDASIKEAYPVEMLDNMFDVNLLLNRMKAHLDQLQRYRA